MKKCQGIYINNQTQVSFPAKDKSLKTQLPKSNR